MRLVHLLAEPGLRQLAADAAAEPPNAVDAELSNLPKQERVKLQVRLGHVREVLTGYRSGHADFAAAGEPRLEYAEDVPLMRRYEAKARECEAGLTTVRRWVADYQREGPLGLTDRDAVSAARPASHRVDPRWLAIVKAELKSRVPGSLPTKQLVLREVAKLVLAEYGPDVVTLPGKTIAYEVLTELSAGTNNFKGSTKGKRSIDNRPDGAYGRLVATRPGEYMMLDTNNLDVFAMDPRTLQWHRVELTVAMDLYSRAILGLCVTPTTKSIDVSWVLREALDPATSVADGTLAYAGHPTEVLIDAEKMVDEKGRPLLPSVAAEAIVVDHGKVYVSDHVYSVCQRQGISVQPARPYTPTDKAAVERLFRTLKDELLVALPGYKGADIASRGRSVEEDAYYFIDEIEQIIREWVVEVYHRTPHDGLCVPEVPGLEMSPLDMLEHGVARAGHLRVPARQDWAFDWLKVAWRTIQHYGVELFGLRYNGPALNAHRDQKSSLGGSHPGKWPIHYDPRDIRQVWFQEPDGGQWSPLSWEHAGAMGQAFGQDALKIARRLARTEMRFPDEALALEQLLSRWDSGRAADKSERRKAVEYASRHDLLHPTDADADADADADVDVDVEVENRRPEAKPVLPGVQDDTPTAVSDDDDDTDVQAAAPDETGPDGYYDDALELL